MGRNKISFVDLCQGEFGRKTAYTGVDQITPQNVAQVLSDTIGIHNRNRTLMDYLYRYYKGDQPILYREKLVRPEVNNKLLRIMPLKQSNSRQGRYMENLFNMSVKRKKRVKQQTNKLIGSMIIWTKPMQMPEISNLGYTRVQ